mmetsp:Transcript_3668/g.8992  ORF Transcript_3668/g.8992 Transcript_3668/m.8992 type:complete len:143 (+) Transcript_3668:183-611(+)
MFAAIKEAASQLAEKTEEGVGLLATHLSEEGRHKLRLEREAAEIERRNEEACRVGFAGKRAVWFRDWKRDLGFLCREPPLVNSCFPGPRPASLLTSSSSGARLLRARFEYLPRGVRSTALPAVARSEPLRSCGAGGIFEHHL